MNYVHHLHTWIEEDPWMMGILEVAATQQLPDWWICAGFIRSKIWDKIHGFTKRTPLPDIDLIYFSHRPEESHEKKIEHTLHLLRPDVPWSVKNQARMHHINHIPPYRSASDGIAHFPETATALGVRLCKDGKLHFVYPYGLKDAFQLRVCPTPYVRTNPSMIAVYTKRVKQKDWRSTWPLLQVDLPASL
ncbi:nucleotidyltransferase family protein [Mechercharimyces sp. CAU 1602]|uniref:nucleotidyltransferase family protein n=1 Tax=Mechercharimyces sp. CAU 1602 TaxID=2973933 RepID=UPI00216136C8|nr:nucleotidyltransferase family protein [Mechercharimyces sp. CAU 1602]MCS1351567.1 nucleotidyltransferase family protein [Mechercharimyces sp. CAU 1602]